MVRHVLDDELVARLVLPAEHTRVYFVKLGIFNVDCKVAGICVCVVVWPATDKLARCLRLLRAAIAEVRIPPSEVALYAL